MGIELNCYMPIKSKFYNICQAHEYIVSQTLGCHLFPAESITLAAKLIFNHKSI